MPTSTSIDILPPSSSHRSVRSPGSCTGAACGTTWRPGTQPILQCGVCTSAPFRERLGSCLESEVSCASSGAQSTRSRLVAYKSYPARCSASEPQRSHHSINAFHVIGYHTIISAKLKTKRHRRDLCTEPAAAVHW